MISRVAASVTLVLLAAALGTSVDLDAAAPASPDENCLLQKATRVDGAPDASKLNECTLPANARWCQVRMGSTQAPFMMAVYGGADIVSDTICNTGAWELSASDITSLGKPGHALDIGANVGFYSFALASAGWTVTSFEPMAANTDLMLATMCANPQLKKQITLNKFGLGSKDDHCVMISGDDNLGDGVSLCGDDAKKPVAAGYSKRATMDIRRLDDVLTEEHVDNINFVKMDVEGFECQVMAGGQSLLTKFRPRLIQSEVWPKMQGCQPQDYLAAYAKAKYSVTRDRGCTMPDLTRPTQIDNRYMCTENKETGLSLLQTDSSAGRVHRSIVWLTPSDL